jgi:hypothetical protein
MTTKPKIRLIRKMGHIKGNQWLWEAEKELGRSLGAEYWIIGTVQADGYGENVMEETWEDEQ